MRRRCDPCGPGREGVSADRVGSAADEAAKLLGVAEEWARSRAGAFHDAEHLATGAPECTLCPVCQAVGALRQVRPEAVGHLLDAAASLVAALRASVPVPPDPPGPAGVQRIRLDDEDL